MAEYEFVEFDPDSPADPYGEQESVDMNKEEFESGIEAVSIAERDTTLRYTLNGAPAPAGYRGITVARSSKQLHR